MADTRLLLRRGTANQWQAANAVMSAGGPGFADTGNGTGVLKIGDGTTAWNDLTANAGPSGPAGETGPAGADRYRCNRGRWRRWC